MMILGKKLGIDRFLEAYGIDKVIRKREPICIEGMNGKLNRYVKRQQERLSKLANEEITRLWKLADKLLRRSKGFRLLALRNVSPNWYKEEDWTKVQGWIEELNGICYRSRPHMKSVEHRSPKQTGRCVISTTQGFPGDATYSCGI
jgi:hypothetical protein